MIPKCQQKGKLSRDKILEHLELFIVNVQTKTIFLKNTRFRDFEAVFEYDGIISCNISLIDCHL